MITILAEPMPIGKDCLGQTLTRTLRTLRNLFYKPKYNYGKYKGHYAVTRSLVEGLAKAKLPFIYSPTKVSELTDIVVVLAGVKTLLQVIALKQSGIIKKIYAGPNIVVFSSDHNNIIAHPEIDVVITPSDWVINLYTIDNPTLIDRCIAWPAGVDVEYWKPSTRYTRKKILIYEKQNKGIVGPIQPYVHYIKSRGYDLEIIHYGCFTHKDYLQKLQQAILMIGFVRDESQGLAWSEAWSTDVPTLIWRNEVNTCRDRSYSCSTAPYLTRNTGLFFTDFEDFKHKFLFWEQQKHTFSAREWTISHMSDEVCASKLYSTVTSC